MNEEQSKKFEELVRPLMEFLAKNFHPHMSIIVTSTNAEMVEGVENFVTYDFIELEDNEP